MSLFNFDRPNNTQQILNTKPKPILENRIKANKFLEVFDRIRNTNSKLLDFGNNYRLVQEKHQLQEYIDAINNNELAAIDTETTGLNPINDIVVGFSIYTEGLPPAYIPVNHVSYITGNRVKEQLNSEDVTWFFSSLERPKWVMFNAQFDIRMMWNTFGIRIEAYYDAYTAQRLLNENEESNSLKDLYIKYPLKGQGDPVYFADLFDKVTADKVPIDSMFIYGAHDSLITYELYKFQIPYLNYSNVCKQKDLSRVADVFWTIEMPIVNILSRVEDVGLGLDYELNEKIGEVYRRNINSYLGVLNNTLKPYQKEVETYQKAKQLDDPINFNSSHQLSIIMYDIMGLKHNLRKKKERSTDKFVLGDINNEFTKALLEYKRYKTLVNNFVIKMPNKVSKDGRIHTSLNPQGANTMRFSSSNPNLQQIPSRDKFIRKSFLPREGYTFISGDYSKQEVVITAYLSNDENMLQAFRDGKDIYSAIASLAYELPYDDCTEDSEDGKERRGRAKAIVLGILYSKGIQSIGDDLGVSKDVAQDIYDKVMEAFPSLQKFMEDSVESAKQRGFVTTYHGTKRRLPDINMPRVTVKPKKSSDYSTNVRDYWYKKINKARNSGLPWAEKRQLISDVEEEADEAGWIVKDNSGFIAESERRCVNSIVQGSAAYMIKVAMITLDNNKEFKDLGGEIVIPIHDEILCQCPKENSERCAVLMEKSMVEAAKTMGMDINVDISIEERWTGEMTDDLYKELEQLGR